jgi:hypothetical protein
MEKASLTGGVQGPTSRGKLLLARTWPEVTMTVAVQLDFKDATLEQYDEGLEGAGLLPGGPSPPGQLFHFVVKVDGGIRVIDVWESRDAYEKFAASSIIPISREVGMSDTPEVQLFEVHSYFTPRRFTSLL